MSTSLSVFIEKYQLSSSVLSAIETEGFLTAIAASPKIINAEDWLPYLWGNDVHLPFSSKEELEQYSAFVIQLWEEKRVSLIENTWKWHCECGLSDTNLVNDATREYCEGLLDGFAFTRALWENLMPEGSPDNNLLNGVLLSVGLLFNPEEGIHMMKAQNAEDLTRFDKIYHAVPAMLSGLTQRGIEAYQESSSAIKASHT